MKTSDWLLLFLIFLIVTLVCLGATCPSTQSLVQGDAEQTSVGTPENQNATISENNTNQNNVKNESEQKTMPPYNLAPIPSGWWLDREGQEIDYAVWHSSENQVSIKLLPTSPSGNNPNRECDSNWFDCKPGDHIVLECWIKIENSRPFYEWSGARIGVDLGASVGGKFRGLADFTGDYVHWGATGWVHRVIDFIVPDDYYTYDNYNEEAIPPTQAQRFAAWLQVWSSEYGGTESGNAWFADAELYINPEEPEPPIPPSPAEYYTVVVSAGVGGQAAPAGSNQVLVGTNFNVHATANTDYTFNYWTRNGTQVSTNANYTITNGTANSVYTMIAYFTYTPPPTSTFTVIISSATGGSTAPSGTQTSNVGTPISITATTDEGYTFNHWLRNSSVYSTSNPVSISGYANQTITVRAVFEANPPPEPPTPPAPTTYTVNIETATGGSTNYTGVQTVTAGNSLTVRAEPNSNYAFSYWLLDNVNASTNPFITITGTAGSTYNLRPVFQYVAPPPPPSPTPLPPAPVPPPSEAPELPSVTVVGTLGGTLLPTLIGKFEKQKPINFDDLISALKKANL